MIEKNNWKIKLTNCTGFLVRIDIGASAPVVFYPCLTQSTPSPVFPPSLSTTTQITSIDPRDAHHHPSLLPAVAE